VCSAQGLQRCLAVHRFVRSGEAAEVSEPPAVRDGGNGAVEGVCGPQIPVGTAESDHADIRHRRHAQVTLESLLQRANADVALPRQCRDGQRQVRSALNDVHRITDRRRPARLRRRGQCLAIGVVEMALVARDRNGPGLTAQFLDASYWRAFSPSLIVELVRPPIRVVHVYRAARLTGAETSALPL
jgi:hypothetical protein